MTGTTITSAGLDERRRRLLYRAWHRGMKEMDLIMGRFADAAIADMSETELGAFEQLSEAPDHDLYNWIANEAAVPAPYDSALIGRLRAFHNGRKT